MFAKAKLVAGDSIDRALASRDLTIDQWADRLRHDPSHLLVFGHRSGLTELA